eukprot:CAMPEP_0174322814 /NCGR_PEP_ID=MMETSP0810-20121108/11298_1 /TAXON_ID=73025 ORGANISM="Eutreptiella gymnastica-like, Strain CCMP1594" /NCGR_SAMPLE_ID=MMETSP0810 /ASSEMBLY_ACC=CAM_ASM_000659 /LENGTH=49 /DNA_ID= /DNA_START= /DNA_END= /DNA_ORIENTATION=
MRAGHATQSLIKSENSVSALPPPAKHRERATFGSPSTSMPCSCGRGGWV